MRELQKFSCNARATKVLMLCAGKKRAHAMRPYVKRNLGFADVIARRIEFDG